MQKLSEDETLDVIFILKRRMLNDRLIFAERGFLDGEGLQGKQWFKHLVSICPTTILLLLFFLNSRPEVLEVCSLKLLNQTT